jgi:hypothetical protein
MKRFVLSSLSVLLVAAAAPVRAEAPFTPNLNSTNTVANQVVAQALASGSFVTTEQDHPTNGTASIVSEGGQRYLKFNSAFETAEGPDVQVVLYRGDTVPVNLQEEDYLTLAPLQSFDGAQRYAIPEGVNLSEFGAVAIWCREFNVTFGYAALEG